jgi:hypothetical protein
MTRLGYAHNNGRQIDFSELLILKMLKTLII